MKQRIPKYRWSITTMVFLTTSISFFTRSLFSIALPEITKEIPMSPALTGIILSAFFWTHAGFMVPSGYIADRFEGKKVYTIVSIIWAALTMLTSFITWPIAFFISRFCLGISQAPTWMEAAVITNQWHPDSERSFVAAYFDSGSKFGAVLTYSVFVLLMGVFGWKSAFLIAGAVTLAITVYWAFIYKKPADNNKLSKEEYDYIKKGQIRANSQIDDSVKISRQDFLKCKKIWGIMIGFFCILLTFYFYSTWLPTYIKSQYDLSTTITGILSLIPPFFGMIAQLSSGKCCDMLAKRGMAVTKVRKLTIIIGLVMALSIIPAAFIHNLPIAITLLTLSYCGISWASPSFWSLPGDLAPTDATVGAVASLQSVAGQVGSIVGPMVVGFVLEATGSFTASLATIGAVTVVGALSYIFLLGEIKPLTLEDLKINTKGVKNYETGIAK